MVSGNGCEKIYPVLNFADAGFPSDLLECTRGFQKPTPIQSQVRCGLLDLRSWCCALRDLI